MDDREFESINVVPLVDVMLVLLTIVLTTSTFIASGVIPVALPKAVNGTATVVESVTIEINKNGNVFYEGKPCGIDSLNNRMATVSRQTPVLIRADKNIELQRFVSVMDMVKGLGFTQVSLQTEGQG